MSKAQWRDKRAILRDLARVTQGRVPVRISDTITDDRPPAQVINEEIEDEYLRYGSGDANFAEGPDLPMIREMLSMVDHVNGKPNDEEESRSIALEITKITPPPSSNNDKSTTFSLSTNRISPSKAAELSTQLTRKTNSQAKTVKAKLERNVAIASLLKVYAGVAPVGFELPKEESAKQNDTPKQTVCALEENDLRLDASPKDEPSTEVQQTSVEAVDRLRSQRESAPKKGPILCADAFRFKKATKVSLNPVEKSVPPKAADEASPPTAGYGKFVPSSYATELYNTLVQNSKMASDAAEKSKEDVWVLAERQMRELEARREAQAEEEIQDVMRALQDEGTDELPTVPLVLDSGVEIQIPAAVSLPQHRHKLTGDCKVCEALTAYKTKKNLNSEETEEINIRLQTIALEDNVIESKRSQEIGSTEEETFSTEPTDVDESKVNLDISKLAKEIKDIPQTTLKLGNSNDTKKNEEISLIDKNKEKNPEVLINNVENKADDNLKPQKSIGKAKDTATAVAHKLTDTYVPDFWEDLIFDPPST